MGYADTEYFDFLVRSTQIPEGNNDTSEKKISNGDPMDELHHRLQYIIEATGYGHQEVEDVHTDAMLRKLEQEQNVRNAAYKREFMKMFGRISKRDIKKVSETVTSRTEDVKWHISYYSERDRKWAEIVMRELGCKHYALYPSIDECLGLFRKSK